MYGRGGGLPYDRIVTSWRPGRRKSTHALEAPHEGVPPHLAQPLWNWIEGGFRNNIYGANPERLEQIAIDLRMPLRAGSVSEQVAIYLKHCNEDEGFFLDVAEALLERYAWDNGRALELQDLLRNGNSAYAVKDSWNGLEERVVPGVKEAVTAVVGAASGSAGDHLRNAWNGAYGRTQDAAKAYSEAIKAVEAALAPHVSPQNSKQTLGTMIKDVSQKPSKWKFVVADTNGGGVETVLRMMQTLWEGQTSRHGGATTTRVETTDEARAAVHLAATLVQLGVSGAFTTA
jgi:hypothetical protein